MSNNSMPSLTALLGLLAIAGYQNRDKIADMIKGMTGGGAAAPADVPKSVTDAMQQGGSGGVTGALGGIVDMFKKAGHSSAADSWVAKGPNQSVTPQQTSTALGGDLLDQLAQQTGLSRDELLQRLSQVLPQAVDAMTPNGRIGG